jgi:type II secretory pathway pseudopilin PulG
MRRAFTITEMLFVLMLMGVAGLMSARLFTSSMRVISVAPAQQEQHAAIDRMSDLLRHDVWGATKIELPDAQTINLTQPGGDIIRWRHRDTEIVRSATNSQGEARWPLATALEARQQGPSLMLVPKSGGDELRFVSQMLAQQGAQR